MLEPYLTITPLGGHGEIGMNCQKWQTDQGVVLVDCGLMFPEDSLLGIDVVIPRLDSVFSEGENILGIVLTHGHEDHIGALPWLFLQYKTLHGVRIFGSPFTLALVAHKMEEHGLCDRVELVPVEAYSRITLGNLTFHFFPVCHSIPQSYALGVETPVGKIIHTGDFKLDSTPLKGEDCSICADFQRLSQEGTSHGIRLLLSDSTNVEIDGRSLPERQVRDDLDAIFSEVKGRIFIALFSSHIRRIRTVLQLAKKYDRAVLVSGRSLSTNIEKAVEMGLIEPPQNLYSEVTGFPDLEPERTVVLATGTQGEALSALARIVRGEHRRLSLHKGDTVIMSSRVIPGNARAVSRVLNQIYRLGASVYHDPRRNVHATGHACREELKDVIALLRPDHFIPVHGEYRHLALHGQLAEECGVRPEGVHILEDGQPITFTASEVRLEKPVSVEFVLVDGKGVGDVGRMVLKERRLLGDEGLVVVILALSAETGEVLYGPEMISRGFVFEQHYSHVLEDAKCLVLDLLESMNPTNGERLSERIRSSLRRFFRDVLGRDPVVIPIVTQI